MHLFTASQKHIPQTLILLSFQVFSLDFFKKMIGFSPQESDFTVHFQRYFSVHISPTDPAEATDYWCVASWSYKDFADETLGLRRRIARILSSADNHISKGVGLNPTPFKYVGLGGCPFDGHPNLNLSYLFTVTAIISHSTFPWHWSWRRWVGLNPTHIVNERVLQQRGSFQLNPFGIQYKVEFQ